VPQPSPQLEITPRLMEYITLAAEMETSVSKVDLPIMNAEMQTPVNDVDLSIMNVTLNNKIRSRFPEFKKNEKVRNAVLAMEAFRDQGFNDPELEYIANVEIIEMIDGLNSESFSRVVNPHAIVDTTPSSSSTELDDNIYILAFICKSLPKCPNPDPALQWAF
jgi:hypothetical protein